jgi:ParB family transcriptional regulator, chromosome partitioning protein
VSGREGMAKRDRLGKGLGALLGEYLGEESAPGTAVPARMIPVSSIAPNPFQPRREFSEEELADLTSSLKENGLLQPIMVRPAAPGGRARYELVAGERRWRASMRLGWKEIPATVREMDDRTLLVLALVENMQRAELSPLEEAAGFHRLGEEFSLSQQQIAELVGRDRSTVANTLRLLHLPASVRQLLGEGKLSAGHARALLGLENDRRMSEIAQQAAEHGWSVRAVESEVQRARGRKERRPRGQKGRDANERVLEEELQRVLGTQVQIQAGRGQRGKIEIPFVGSEDFERIFELLAGRSASDVLS